MRISRSRPAAVLLAAVVGAAVLAGCGDGDTAGSTKGRTVTLVTHESFNASKDVLADFTKQTGYELKILRSGDAGTAVNQAILTRGNPQGDVFFGVDNTFLSRALEADIFQPYRAEGLDEVPEQFRANERVTPVDYGDVCVNYDKKRFAGKTPPQTFADLVKPEYANQLVVENPATSSPGLAFLLGTIDAFGPDGWQDYWKKLKANGVLVVDGWEEAYNQRFSAGPGKGDRPLVVSYASSPPAEVLGAEKPLAEAPTGVSLGTCFRQYEYAGLLTGAKNADGGRKLLDFLLSKRFQEDVPLQMFVFPVRADAELPEVFRTHAKLPTEPATLPPDQIAENRDAWIKTWTGIVLR